MTTSSPPVALVTGAAGIIGPGICAVLRDAGWRVAAADRSEEDFSRLALFGRELDVAARLTADLRRPEECARLIGETRERVGPVRLLINNATGHDRPCAIGQADSAEARKVLGVDLLAPLFLSQAAVPDLREGGLIVNVSSVRVENLTVGTGLYSVAKAAVEKLTQVLAFELAAQAIRVNCIRVGSVPGDAFLRPALALLSPELGRRLRAEILPLHFAAAANSAALTGGAGDPRDIGRFIAFLASEGGRHLNGAVLPMDGGFSLAQQRARDSTPGSPIAREWTENPRAKLNTWLAAQGLPHVS